MEILNTTPFQFGAIAGRLRFPGHSLTVMVKATFQLAHGETARLADKQLYPAADQFAKGDEDQTGSPRYETDAAFFKPRGDLLLIGKCHPPDGQPVTACPVTFRVGEHSRSLLVFGDRCWRPGIARSDIGVPEPFTEFELVYENAFGGEGDKRNPVGKGAGPAATPDGKSIHRLPNLEDPNNLIVSPRSRPEPACFGPRGRLWEPRLGLMGTYDAKWETARWPWFPEDFDFAYFNSAPAEMQVDYLRGDEELYFENLHPRFSRYQSRLPGQRVRCFLNCQVESGDNRFEELVMNLDTLWVDMEAEQLVLVWRGVAAVQDQDYGEVEHLYIATEPVEAAPLSVQEYQEQFSRRLTELEAEWEGEPLPDEMAEPAPMETDTVEVEATNREFDELLAAQKTALLEQGIDIDNPPPPDPESQKEFARIMGELGIDFEKQERDAQPVTTPQPPDRSDIEKRHANNAGFAGEDLSNLDLSGLKLDGANFENCVLSGTIFESASLAGANLAGAILTGSNLTGANLENASLNGADLTHANLAGANLAHANLTDATFENANLRGASLAGAVATDTGFTGACLDDAKLTNGDFSGADFSDARLDRTSFAASSLREATFDRASGANVVFDKADLSELRASEGCHFSNGSFREVVGAESVWEDAQLNSADFSYSRLDTADFSGASLNGAVFHAASLKTARFDKADLSAAQITQANLFQAVLEKANLSGTDLDGSSLYEAEFLDATLHETSTRGANLKMTKLLRPAVDQR